LNCILRNLFIQQYIQKRMAAIFAALKSTLLKALMAAPVPVLVEPSAPPAPPTPAERKPIILSIEGNIGSGKSTLLERLKQLYVNDPTIGFIQEPIDVWNTITDSDGKTILEKYYADQKKYAFSFQMMAYISRLSILRNAMKSNYRVIIIERSIHTDAAVFAKMLFDDKKIEEIEYNIYMRWFDEFIWDLPPIRLVYVRADPEVALARVIKRARVGEEISLDYLTNCHKYHEDWLIKRNITPLLVLNANIDIYADAEGLRTWIEKIHNFML
jgi:deoxyadenosine/deoxycytidine kinase